MRKPAIFLLLLISVLESYAQCSSIRQQRNITFNTDKDCAPVTVTDFTITYFFNTPQNPADVVIRFDWNDPANNFDEYSQGDANFSVGGTNTEFTAVGTFTYPENDQCVFEPVSSVIVAGEACETSEQVQVVTSWSRDNDFGGDIAIMPENFNVCYNNPVVNAVFEDNSTFNCNINQEPDNPNRLPRHTQFVYGTNHNPAASIRDLSLVDDGGNTVDLTDGSANLGGPETRSGVTAAYFGPIVEIPFPADGPNLQSFPISAPANADNQVGNVFEITLYNWNICNPYNGDAANPNYNDAVQTTAYIEIVEPPVPAFVARLNNASGAVQEVFCLGERIYFENQTTGVADVSWEFYDDPSGNTRVGTSGATNPVFTFNTAGEKLIRLTASNPNAQGSCTEVYEDTIAMSPAAMAAFGLYTSDFSAATNGDFCAAQTESITVGFRDETINIEPETEWRWEFYDSDGNLEESIPPGANTYGDRQSDFTRTFTGIGDYQVRLIARNSVTQCESVAIDSVRLYAEPVAYFEADTVCAGVATSFVGIADSIGSLAVRVNEDRVATYEWDFSYDGSAFQVERSTASNDPFERMLDGTDGAEPAESVAGTYSVALRMITEKGGCIGTYIHDVVVNPLPGPQLGSNYSGPVCPGDSVMLFNQSDLATADFFLIFTDSVAYYDTIAFNQADTSLIFENTRDTARHFYLSLKGITPAGCEEISEPMTVEVLPAFQSGFTDVNYSVSRGNCSVWSSTLEVNSRTQNLNADTYTWSIADENGLLAGYPIVKNAGDPDFHRLDYELVNASPSNKLFTITLEVEKAGVCVLSSQEELVINPSPSSAFSVERIDSCAFAVFELSADQTGLASYDWEFTPAPDQHLDDENNQRLVYLREAPSGADIPIVFRLVTENLANCSSDTSEYVGQVDKSEPPLVAGFEIDRDTLLLPDSVLTLNNTSSGATAYLWDFGDGQTQTTAEPGTHAYPTAGVYRIELEVSNTYCEAFAYKNVVVEPPEPIIDFNADVLAGCAPLTVQFLNESQFTNPASFRWEFGDGNTSTAENPAHTYARAGSYTVSLYGENMRGVSDVLIREDYVQVYAQPVADFAVNPSVAFVPDTEVFFRNASQTATSFSWDFGDGQTSTDLNPRHTYSEVGTYDIQLIASNDQGCVDSLLIESGVEAVAGGNVKTPNAFSPGGSNGADAFNDVFLPRVEGVSEFRMFIYNRWGELLFESLDPQLGWDGFFNGQLQPADVYVYRLELTYSDGREQVKIGDVTLVR
ncbi:gliding motility-associated C-terminal domain-containing protein [Marinoscillum furvescens]|uniref:Gliding motility-associated-like protein n=1 Tax=Marinoscillum furvescens DSM 4134 TaxID=1122208 RepID=A0A3D9KYP0_MARFU|nr:PKD domain-containing protein [Marinoscillum furvescens]RED94405.1 gliding motility-associated-like protein [Marinoscillum furvescens DSM 4134]